MKIVQIDAFTDRPFRGNPAAVCIVESYPEAIQMQMLAAELNLSETAFLKPAGDDYELRWFTPSVEVDLCGHATLASAHYLWSENLVDSSREISFRTRGGVLKAVRREHWIEMDFPAQPAEELGPADGLLEAVGVQPRFVGKSEADWLIELASEERVRGLRPDLTRLSEVCERGLIVTSVSDSDRYDFVSRFFAPAVGVDEDPVTGSAHCCLGPYWAERLHKTELVGFQASPRGGEVWVRPQGDRILIAGSAVTVMHASLDFTWPQLL